MTGAIKESKQIAHSSSEPELRINFIFFINFFRSSSGDSEDLQDLLELKPKKDVLFIIGDWNAKEVKKHLD